MGDEHRFNDPIDMNALDGIVCLGFRGVDCPGSPSNFLVLGDHADWPRADGCPNRQQEARAAGRACNGSFSRPGQSRPHNAWCPDLGQGTGDQLSSM